MSAYGRNLSFSISIAAKDDSQSGLRSASQRILSFAKRVAKPIMIPFKVGRRGLAFMRDIELGLRPVVAGIDRLIERGSGLEVVSKSFKALTETGGKQTQTLARQLRDAASGTIRLGEAMEVANRGLASGLSFDQLITAMDFVSKKAITTGMSAAGAIDKVITGLSRGSVLFLDDFGLVVDGLEGIAREYDKIKGAGAFDSLGPAAQKAAIVNQAIKEMRQQLGKIGVSGRESVFVWQGLKNQIGDSVDKLVLAVAKSKALQDTLKGLRNILSGITRYLEDGKNNSIWDVFLGKKGTDGKRGVGLIDIGKSMLLDAGEWIGRGILGGLLVGISEIPDVFSRLWDKLQGILDNALAAIPTKIQEGIDWLKGRFPDVAAAHTNITNTFGEWIHEKFSWLYNRPGEDGKIKRGVLDTTIEATTVILKQTPSENLDAFVEGAKKAGESWIRGVERAWARITGGQDPGPLRRAGQAEERRVGTVPASILGALGTAVASSAMAMASDSGKESKLGWPEMVSTFGHKILSGGTFRTGGTVDKFLDAFPPVKQTKLPKLPSLPIAEYPLTQTAMFDVTRRIQQLNREIRSMPGSRKLRQQAREQALAQIEATRAQGRYVPNTELHRLTKEILAKLIEQATKPLLEELDQLQARRAESKEISQRRRQQKKEERERRRIEQERRQLDRDWNASGMKPSADNRGPMPADKSLDDLVKAVRENTKQSKQVYAALTGASSQLGQSM